MWGKKDQHVILSENKLSGFDSYCSTVLFFLIFADADDMKRLAYSLYISCKIN